MKKHFILIVGLMLLFLTNFNFAQEITRASWGISAALNSTQADILFPFWLDNSNTLAPAIGVVGNDNAYTDISLGIVYHHYFNYSSNFSPIIGFRGGAIIESPKIGDNVTDGIVGILGGGEYFFSSNFSVGIEAQVNFAFSGEHSLRFGNPGGTNYNTGSVIFASVYF
jgi:hypothetical protein